MAERKGSLIAKSVSKHAGRAKEKLLQNLGKVDRTADEIFDEHLENFNRQQAAAARLQKEFNNYIRCIRAVQSASKSLYECVNDVYESGWTGQDNVYIQSNNLEMLWQDLSHKLADQVLLPLNTYYAQFPEMKKKIDKRSRKLVDYDGQRHNLQSLEGGGKKRDEAKILKAKEMTQQAKRTYDTLNSELHDELPALYHSRVFFLVNNLQQLFASEQVFHTETSKVFSELEAIIDKLATDSQKQHYTPKRALNSPQQNNVNNVRSTGSPVNSPAGVENEDASPPSSPKEVKPPSSPQSNNSLPNETESKSSDSVPNTNGKLNNDPSTTTSSGPEEVTNASTPNENGGDFINTVNTNTTSSSTGAVAPVNGNAEEERVSQSSPAAGETNNNKRVEELCDIPPGATTENLPPGTLYRVKATYRYNREDVDELSFDVGEIIRVVAYDDPEEQEEGWLMGVKETTGEKGMFPANFTRPI